MTEQEVRALVDRQVRAWQAFDADGVVADFTPDGVLESPGGRWAGRAALHAEASAYFTRVAALEVDVTAVEPDGDTGRVRWTWTEVGHDGRRTSTETDIAYALEGGAIAAWIETFPTAYWFPGDQVIDIKLDGARTGGAFMLLEVVTGPGGGAPQPHVHTREDETLVLLEGQVEVTIGGERRTVRPGDVVFFPRGVPHSFANPGPATSRGLGIVAPAGLEAFFRELGTLKTGPERPPDLPEPDAAAWQAAADRAGMQLLPADDD